MNEDSDPLEQRVSKIDTLIDEIFKILRGLLDWKSQTQGGFRVFVYGIGLLQAIVLTCLGYAANSLNKTAETLGNHAIELATAKTKIEAFMNQGPRFTAEMDEINTTKLEVRLRQWVHDELKQHELNK